MLVSGMVSASFHDRFKKLKRTDPGVGIHTGGSGDRVGHGGAGGGQLSAFTVGPMADETKDASYFPFCASRATRAWSVLWVSGLNQSATSTSRSL